MALLFLILVVTILSAFVYLHTRTQREREKSLFRETNLAIRKEDGAMDYPKFRKTANKFILQKYNPSITNHDFDSKKLQAFTKVFCKNNEAYLLAEYENSGWRHFLSNHNKSHLVLYNSNLVQTDYFKDRPHKRPPYSFWVGRDIENRDTVYSIQNRQGIALSGQSGLGKTSLANVILFGLDQNVSEEHIFTKSRADYFESQKTKFHYKDDEATTLEVLRGLKVRAIEDQKKLDEANRQSIYEVDGKLKILVFDEAHSYLKNSTSLPKGQKEIRAEIIELTNWFLRQARSVGYICIFILPNPEREMLDVNIRDCAFLFSTKLSSEQVSQNMFRSAIAFLIPPKMGLFVVTDGNGVKVVQVPKICWKRKL